MEIRVFDSRLPHTAFEEVLIGSGFVGLPVFLAKHIALSVIAGVLGGNGVLDFFVIRQVLKKLIQKIDRPSGMVCLG